MIRDDQERQIYAEIINRYIEFIRDDKWEDAVELFETDTDYEYLPLKALLTVMHYDTHRKEISFYSRLQAIDDINEALNKKAKPLFHFVKSMICYNIYYSPGIDTLAQRLMGLLESATEVHVLNSILNYDHIQPGDKHFPLPAMDHDTNDPLSHNEALSSSMIVREEMLHAALESIDKALQFNAYKADYCLLKAKIVRSVGQLETALMILDEAMSKNPDRDDIILEMLEILEIMGKSEEAICSINEVLSMKPSNMTFIEKKLRLLIKYEMNDALVDYRDSLILDNDLSCEISYALIDASLALHDVPCVIYILNRAIVKNFVPEGYFSRVLRECIEYNLYGEAKKVISLSKLNNTRYGFDHDVAIDGLEELYFIIYDSFINDGMYRDALIIAEEAIADDIYPFQTERIFCLVLLDELDRAVSIIQDPEWLLNTDYFENMLDALWRKSNFNAIHQLCDVVQDTDGYLLEWYNFWACVHLGIFAKASECLSKLSFMGLFKELSDLDNKTNHSYVKELFQHRLPFDKMPVEMFLLMLSLLFEGYISHNEIEDSYSQVHQNSSVNASTRDPVIVTDGIFTDLNARITILKEYLHKSVKFPPDFLHFAYELLFGAIESIQRIMNARIEEVRVIERNSILSNLSHSIKNILKSIIDPLENLKQEMPEKSIVINNAIKGANLIREIVNSINFSYKTIKDDLLWDIANHGNEKVSLQEILLGSIQYSISNMFDYRYFPQYAQNYFPSNLAREEFENIKAEWSYASSSREIESVIIFAKTYLCKLNVYITEAGQYAVGNDKSSSIKLMILFQEIILNAIKYASYSSIEERFIEVSLINSDNNIIFKVANSYCPEVQAKTTGVGKHVIENFAILLDCIPVITTDKNIYSITLEFKNIWRNNAKNPLY